MSDSLSLANLAQRRELAPLIAQFRALRPAIVTLDGPAGSGKSTVGYQLAQLVDFLFFDTGAMYRAVTWAVLHEGISVNDEARVSAIAQRLTIEVTPPTPKETDGRQCTVLADGQDITTELRTPAIDQNVSIVSAYPVVRQEMSSKQRTLSHYYGAGKAEKAGIIMAGRDIGTVVVPEAPLKIYLDASAVERARRRYTEQQGQGKSVELTTVLNGILQRDELDSHRAVSPLRPADDAIVLDTSNLSPAEVIRQILQLANEARQAGERGDMSEQSTVNS